MGLALALPWELALTSPWELELGSEWELELELELELQSRAAKRSPWPSLSPLPLGWKEPSQWV